MTSQIFKVIYAPKDPAILSTEQIALGFINALKLEGLKDTPSVEDKYYYAFTEFPNEDVRIDMVALPSAPIAQLIRPKVMFALKVLSLALIRDECLQEMIFQEGCRGEDLYRGGLSKKNNALDLLQESEPATNVSLIATQKRASSIPETNGIFTIPGPGPSNDWYQMRIGLVGNTLPKPGMFSVIIDWLFGLGGKIVLAR